MNEDYKDITLIGERKKICFVNKINIKTKKDSYQLPFSKRSASPLKKTKSNNHKKTIIS